MSFLLRTLVSLSLLACIFPATTKAKTVEYDLTISLEQVDFTGQAVPAMTVNGSIPGPNLEFTVGDTAIIRVHNLMAVETSIHWHGLLLPNREDGVPYLTTPPIMPGAVYTYSFPLKQAGTYWYHSHTGLQEQRGVYGSIVINPKLETIKADREYILVLSDWTDENPHEVLRTLKRGSEYYSLRKGSIQSLVGAFQMGALAETFQRSLMRMPPMDISDVAYDSFLINGKPEGKLPANPGETVRLRIINAGASSYFYLQFAGGGMNLVAADGLDIKPVVLDRFLIAIAETYDVLVTIPDDGGSFEFRATAQDGSGQASIFLGSGERQHASDVRPPNPYVMAHGDMAGSMRMSEPSGGAMADKVDKNMGGMAIADQAVSSMGMKKPVAAAMDEAEEKQDGMVMAAPNVSNMQMGEMASDRPLAPYGHLRSLNPIALDLSKKLREITLTLTGDMERYVWSFDDMILSEADVITIERGENVRITFVNKTMMHHPLHLHGHFFRVVNEHGEYSPLKHTVDISPLGSQIIEFYANEEKDWFLHCHILYHMKVGMARVVHYDGSTVDPDIMAARRLPSNPLVSDPWFAWGEAAILSQMTSGLLKAVNSRNTLKAEWEYDWDTYDYTVDLVYERWRSRFLSLFGGIELEGEEAGRGIFGLRYLLPLLFEGEVRIDTDGEWLFSLDNEVQLSSRLRFFGEVEYDTGSQWEYRAGLGMPLTRRLTAIGLYHSEFGVGGGLQLEF